MSITIQFSSTECELLAPPNANFPGSNNTPLAGVEIYPDDIRVEYHPHSEREPVTMHFEDYRFNKELPKTSSPPPSNPWHPWRSRTDFDVAALALECSMNTDQTNKFVELMYRVAHGNDAFTLKNSQEIQKTWDLASERSTKVCRNL